MSIATSQPRVMGYLVLLLDGTCLYTGGGTTGYAGYFSSSSPNLCPSIYDPTYDTWQDVQSCSNIARLYHSVGRLGYNVSTHEVSRQSSQASENITARFRRVRFPSGAACLVELYLVKTPSCTLWPVEEPNLASAGRGPIVRALLDSR